MTNRRTQLIQLIHVAKRELCMADDSYRLLLGGMPELDGKRSSKDLNLYQLRSVLEEMKRRGFKVKPKAPGKAGNRPLADDAQSRKIRSLWLSLYDMGAVRDPSEQALAHFVANRFKVDDLRWLNSAQASQVIEHLKRWQERIPYNEKEVHP